MNNGKTIALARPTFVSKVMSLLFNTLSSLVMAFLPGSSCLLMSWLQSTLASLRPWFPALHLDHSASSYALPSVCFFWHRYQVQLLSLSAPPQPAPLHIPLRFCCLFHHFIHPALGWVPFMAPLSWCHVIRCLFTILTGFSPCPVHHQCFHLSLFNSFLKADADPNNVSFFQTPNYS